MLIEQNWDCNTAPHWAANNPQCLEIMLESLSESERLKMVIVKNSCGNSVLHLAANNPESLKTVLELLPESHSLKAVRASNFFNLSNLYATIGELKKYGQSLTEKDNSNPKGDLIITLADDLEKLTNRFCIAAIKQDETFSLQEFKQKFLGELSSKKAPLQKHSAQWKPIIANILLALTGVGVVAIAAKAVAATFVAGRSYYRSREKPMAKNFFFWGKTTSTKKLEETNEGLKLVYDKSYTLKFSR